jgi:hypothetical protein
MSSFKTGLIKGSMKEPRQQLICSVCARSFNIQLKELKVSLKVIFFRSNADMMKSICVDRFVLDGRLQYTVRKADSYELLPPIPISAIFELQPHSMLIERYRGFANKTALFEANEAADYFQQNFFS